MEHQHFVPRRLQDFPRPGHAGRGDSEHRRGHQRPVGGDRLRRLPDHPGHGPGRLGQNQAADPVQARDVHHRIQHQDVFVADVLPDLAGGERADHQLGHADRQAAHGRGADGGAGRPAQGQHAVQLAAGMGLGHQPRRAGRGQRHRRAPVVPLLQFRQRGPGGLEHGFPRHFARERRLAQAARVHDHHRDAQAPQAVPHKGRFGPFGIERDQQVDCHDGLLGSRSGRGRFPALGVATCTLPPRGA